MRKRWQAVLPTLALLPACGGSDLSPAPDTIVAGPLTIASDPLRITVTGPAGALDREGFVEIATAATVDDTHYYDPLDRGADSISWNIPTHAIGVDADGWLVLDGGARLRLANDATGAELDLDASGVANAVLARIVLPLDDGEPIFGFGEGFAGANASGQVREMQFRVDGTSASGTNETHVPVPLAMWPARGVGLFVADRRSGAFDLGAARPGDALATFALPARGPFAAHFFVAARPQDLVRDYVALTAAPAIPPRWAFAPQQWRNEDGSSDDVRSDAQTMRSLAIPGSTIWIDNPWQTGYNTFTVDETRFAQFDQLMSDLAAMGYRVVFWSTPYLVHGGVTDADYADARAQGLFVTDDTGSVIDLPWANGPAGLLDLTNPAAVTYWKQHVQRIVDRGASGFKLDYGEDIVPDIGGTLVPMRLAAGDNQEMHGIFSRAYHQAYAAPDRFLITRAGAWGEQDTSTAIWPGDLDNDFSTHADGRVGGLPAAIAGGLSLSVSGYPFFGSDIGGYRGGTPSGEVLARWAEYAAFGTIMQLGGGGDHNPWDSSTFDAATLAAYEGAARLHMRLFPYLWMLAHQGGAPITIPARFVYPAENCDDAMFLLGDAILVAPVIEPGATTRMVHLPPGKWIDWWTGTATDGAADVVADAPTDHVPAWRAADRFLPMFARDADTLEPATAPGVTSYADPAYGGELRLVLAPAGGTASITLDDGSTATGTAHDLAFTPGRVYTTPTFELTGVAAPAQVLVGGGAAPSVADDTALFACAAPGCWRYDAATSRLQIRVPGGGAVRVQ